MKGTRTTYIVGSLEHGSRCSLGVPSRVCAAKSVMCIGNIYIVLDNTYGTLESWNNEKAQDAPRTTIQIVTRKTKEINCVK